MKQLRIKKKYNKLFFFFIKYFYFLSLNMNKAINNIIMIWHNFILKDYIQYIEKIIYF